MLRNPASSAALTEGEFMELPIGSSVCLVYPDLSWKAKELTGRTRRKHARFDQGEWQSFHELGICPDPEGNFAACFCVKYVVEFGFLEQYPEQVALYDRLREAELRIYWDAYSYPTGCGQWGCWPRLIRKNKMFGDFDLIESTLEDIESAIGRVEELIQWRGLAR